MCVRHCGGGGGGCVCVCFAAAAAKTKVLFFFCILDVIHLKKNQAKNDRGSFVGKHEAGERGKVGVDFTTLQESLILAVCSAGVSLYTLNQSKMLTTCRRLHFITFFHYIYICVFYVQYVFCACVLVVNGERYLWFGGSNLSDIRGKTFSLFAFSEIVFIIFFSCVNYRNLSSQNMFCLTGRGDQNKNSNQQCFVN